MRNSRWRPRLLPIQGLSYYSTCVCPRMIVLVSNRIIWGQGIHWNHPWGWVEFAFWRNPKMLPYWNSMVQESVSMRQFGILTVLLMVLYCIFTSYMLNSHPRLRILDNQNNNFSVVVIFKSIFKDWNGTFWKDTSAITGTFLTVYHPN